MTAAWRLAEWAVGLRLADVPESARRAAVMHLLDGLGCAVAAGSTRIAPIASATPAVVVARELGGPPEATIIGFPGRVGAAAAALANGALVHALDFDDTHAGGLVHATAPVLPVAFAVGEETGASGAEVLLAAVIGYETICRLGAAVPHGFHARGLHATSVCGVLAAALVAARLYGLQPVRAVDALGIAGSQAGGLLEFLHTGSSTKQLHPGLAAHAGILAARLARAGASGPATVVEGEHGLYGALLGRPGLDPITDLGQRWEVTRITVKPYPACQLLHAALDAAHQLHAASGPARSLHAGIGPARDFGTASGPAGNLGAAGGPVPEVGALVVDVHPDAAAIVCGAGKDRPRTLYDAKFSLPWSVAAMIIDGEVTVDTYRELDRPEVAALAARISHRVVDSDGPAADQPCRIHDAQGRLLAQVPRSSGGPDSPHREDLVLRKARANGLSDEVVELVLSLDALPALDHVMSSF